MIHCILKNKSCKDVSFALAAKPDFSCCICGQVTSAVELLSGNFLDDVASSYFAAVESFEKVAHGDLGGARASTQDPSTVSDTTNLSPIPGSKIAEIHLHCLSTDEVHE